MTETPAPPAPPAADISGAGGVAKQFNDDLKLLLRELTGYNVWHSISAGHYAALYATRVADLTKAEVAADMSRTIAADNPRDLLNKLKQELQTSAKIGARGANTRTPDGS